MNREYLETLSFKELKEIGKEYNVTSNSTEGLIHKIMVAYRIEESEVCTSDDIKLNKEEIAELAESICEIEKVEVHEEEELNTQLGDEEFDEFERNADGKILMMEDIEEEVYIETVTDITEHIKTIELYQSEHKWIKLKYNMIKKLSGDTYINNVIELSDKILGMVNSGVMNKVEV